MNKHYVENLYTYISTARQEKLMDPVTAAGFTKMVTVLATNIWGEPSAVPVSVEKLTEAIYLAQYQGEILVTTALGLSANLELLLTSEGYSI